MKKKIIPSILVYSKDEYIQQMQIISALTDFVQIDIADGKFVDNTTWHDVEFIKDYCPVNFELHMMVTHPLKEIQKWQYTPQLKRIIFHYESVSDIENTLVELQKYNREICISLNLETDTKKIEKYVSKLDAVQFMNIIPGKQGQPFDKNILEKITNFHSTFPHMELASDGSVNSQTISELLKAGISRFCVGSAIWKGNPKENYTELQNMIQ